MNTTTIKIEPFGCEFIEPYSCDTEYVISIGDRTLRSRLSDWSTNFNCIRLAIEMHLFSYFKVVDVELFYEDSPTIIRLRNSFLPNHKPVTCATVIPNEFVEAPDICGWCEPRQLVGALYLGLLGICIRETDWFGEVDYWNWDDFRLATYNKLQSCVIENYLKGIMEDEQSYLPRQRVIDSAWKIQDDYLSLLNSIYNSKKLSFPSY